MERVTEQMISDAMQNEARTLPAPDVVQELARQPHRLEVVRLYAIHDAAIDAFTEPRFLQNDAVAYRVHESEYEGSRIAATPADFELWCLGEWDLSTGEFTQTEKRCVIRFKEWIG